MNPGPKKFTIFKIGDAERRKQEIDKTQGEDVRNKAMEKLAETKKRKDIGAAAEPKRRRSTSDTIQYLWEKSEREASLKEKEFGVMSQQSIVDIVVQFHGDSDESMTIYKAAKEKLHDHSIESLEICVLQYRRCTGARTCLWLHLQRLAKATIVC